jgi:DNA-binding HxlR family transcriptional regulator
MGVINIKGSKFKKLWSFGFHGVEFTEKREGGKGTQYVADCPFCGKAQHFFVNVKTSQWDCKRCQRRGNVYSFLEQWHGFWLKKTSDDDYKELGADRGIPWGQFKRSEWAWNSRRKQWLILVRNFKGGAVDLRCYRPGSKVMTTKGRDTGLLGAHELSDPERKKEPVYVNEGEGDREALSWLLRKVKEPGIVLSVPGAGTFKEEWADWLVGRKVYFLYDNDQYGDDGSARAGKVAGNKAKVAGYIHWPDFRDEGYDVRDLVKDGLNDDESPETIWKTLKGLVRPTHRRGGLTAASKGGSAAATSGPQSDSRNSDVPERPKGPIPTFPAVLDVFRKWLKMTDDSILALRVMCATILSNQIPGDPIWMFVVGPPGVGKTEALNAFQGSDVCMFKSSLTAHSLVSGFMAQEDPSLIPQLDGKVLVLKDYTEILAMNQQEQDDILKTLRGAYDGHVEKAFGNGVSRSYTVHFTMLAGVTAAIHGNNRATLGERFLKIQIIKDVAFRADEQVMAAMKNVSKELKMQEELQDVVGRFINRDIDLASIADMVPEWVYQRLMHLAQLIAMLRAKVEREQYQQDSIKFRPQHEVGTRLGKQLVKLAMAIAIVDGKKQIDEDVYAVVERVAFDTAFGFHLDIVQAIYDCGEDANRELLHRETGLPATNLQRQLDDLVMLKIIRKSEAQHNRLGTGVKFSYKLTKRVRELWEGAQVGANHIQRAGLVRRRRGQSLMIRRKVNGHAHTESGQTERTVATLSAPASSRKVRIRKKG